MKNKKVLVLVKYFKGEMNPFDRSALECALQFGFSDITVMTMAPKSVQPHLQSLTRLGVNAILISDEAFAGSDTIATSFVLEKAIRKVNPDLIFCGRQSVDGDTAQIPPMLATRLNFEYLPKVVSITEDRLSTRSGKEYLLSEINYTVITFERFKELRFPSIFSKQREIQVLDKASIGADENLCGHKGSPTKVVKTYSSTVGRRFCKFIAKEDLPSLLENLSKQSVDVEKKQDASCEKLERVVVVGEVGDIAETIANQVYRIDESIEANELIAKLEQLKVKHALFSDSDECKKLASQVAVITNSGLCADCISLSVVNNNLIMSRPAYGGDITADIVCDSKFVLATVRTNKKSLDLVFSVGKGAVACIDKIKSYAQKYGAELCSSRAVVDMGKMPYPAQVGLTGKRVSPKIYLAFGIAGAVQHTCAISGAQTVIAINKDKNSRMFDYADYGIVEEVENVEL